MCECVCVRVRVRPYVYVDSTRLNSLILGTTTTFSTFSTIEVQLEMSLCFLCCSQFSLPFLFPSILLCVHLPQSMCTSLKPIICHLLFLQCIHYVLSYIFLSNTFNVSNNFCDSFLGNEGPSVSISIFAPCEVRTELL